MPCFHCGPFKKKKKKERKEKRKVKGAKIFIRSGSKGKYPKKNITTSNNNNSNNNDIKINK